MHFRPLHDRVVVPRYRTGMPPANGFPSSDPARTARTSGADASTASRASARFRTMPRPRRRHVGPVVPQQTLSPAHTSRTGPESEPLSGPLSEPEFTRGGIVHGTPG